MTSPITINISYNIGTCEPGFYCETGEEAPASPCSVCPPYHVCSGDSNGPIICPDGTIVNAVKDACLLCPAGYTCKHGGAVINQCPQGNAPFIIIKQPSMLYDI